MTKHNKQTIDQKVLEIVRKAVQHDSDLRDQFKIDHKFRFVTDRLNTLLHQLEHHEGEQENSKAPEQYEVASDEMYVYVHLFNVQGIKLSNWQNMLNPNLFYEYSVNRPIYQERSAIENLIAKKTNNQQHAYITIIIKKADVLSEQSKDNLGNTILRVREGSLLFNKFVSFTHNNENYALDSDGNIIRKL